MTEEEEEIKLLNLIFATSLLLFKSLFKFLFNISVVVVYAAYSTPSLALSDAL